MWKICFLQCIVIFYSKVLSIKLNLHVWSYGTVQTERCPVTPVPPWANGGSRHPRPASPYRWNLRFPHPRWWRTWAGETRERWPLSCPPYLWSLRPSRWAGWSIAGSKRQETTIRNQSNSRWTDRRTHRSPWPLWCAFLPKQSWPLSGLWELCLWDRIIESWEGSSGRLQPHPGYL